MKDKSYYFQHDCNARQDEKILALRMKHGWEGYGLYWALIEKLRESDNYSCVCDYNLIAYDLRSDANKIKSIIEDFRLFDFATDENRGKLLYSRRLLEDMNLKDDAREAKVEAGKKGAEAKKKKADPKQCSSTPQADLKHTLSSAQADPKQCSSTPQADLKHTLSSAQADPKQCSSTPQANIIEDNRIEENITTTTNARESENNFEGFATSEAMRIWNNTVSEPMQAIAVMQAKRRDLVLSRLESAGINLEDTEAVSQWLRRTIEGVTLSRYCRGKGKDGWIADFDWLFRSDDNCLKSYEGGYKKLHEGRTDRPRSTAILDNSHQQKKTLEEIANQQNA